MPGKRRRLRRVFRTAGIPGTTGAVGMVGMKLENPEPGRSFRLKRKKPPTTLRRRGDDWQPASYGHRNTGLPATTGSIPVGR
jgi:hypothetical protein